MAAIDNISKQYNPQMKKVSSKLSFSVGDNISAKAISSDSKAGEVTLKLADGWQISAKVENPTELPLDTQLKFEILGLEDGKLILKLINTPSKENKQTQNSILNILTENNLSSKEYQLLEKMLKHEISLTKDNIAVIKSLVDFTNKINVDGSEENAFIDKYLTSRGVPVDSDEGKFIKNLLKSFFSELKTLQPDDIMTMIENDIDINEENIQSFKRVFKEPTGLFNSINKISEFIEKEIEVNNKKIVLNNKSQMEQPVTKVREDLKNNNLNEEMQKVVVSEVELEDKVKNSGSLLERINGIIKNNDIESAQGKEKLAAFLKEETTISEKNIKIIEKNIYFKNSVFESVNKSTSILDELKLLATKDIESVETIKQVLIKENEKTSVKLLEKLDSIIKNSEGSEVKEKILTFLKNESDFSKKDIKIIQNVFSQKDENEAIKIMREAIRETKVVINPITKEIENKTEQMKYVIKNLINIKNEMSKESFSKILEFLKPNVSDLKVYNSASNQYYYMDLPINVNNQEYECKLIVKDDRNSGKKIDSKNVNMVLSVKTVNLGTIDGFLKVRDKKLKLDVKCEEKWINVLELGNPKLVEGLGYLGFDAIINISKKEEESEIVSIRDFFNDMNFSNINVKV